VRSQKVNALVVKSAEGKVIGILQIHDLIADEPIL
jgi:hypothetical protein